MGGERQPRPENWDQYCADVSSGDPVRIAQAKARYNQQLIAAGHRPMYEQPGLWTEKEPTDT